MLPRSCLLTVAAIAALTAITGFGITACGSSGPAEVVVSSDPAPSPAATIEAVTPTEPTPSPEPEEPSDAAAFTPEEKSTGTVLEWTEFDPDEAFGPILGELNTIESVGDGRVLFSTFGPSDNRVMVTENGRDWAELPLPADNIIPRHLDIAGNRWLITGPILSPNDAEPVGIPSDKVFFSDDQGATWTELAFSSDDAPDGISGVIAAMASGERMVVAARCPSATAAEAQDQPSRPDNVVFLRLGIFFSDGGPADLVAEYPSWNTTGYATADGFHLTLFSEEENIRLFSPDGRQWSEDSIGYGDIEGFTFSAGNMATIWTTGPTDGDSRIERFPGVYGLAPVVALPDGISWINDLSVGPAGVAVVAQPGTPFGSQLPTELRIEKEGYELRYNEPEGGITLWDLSQDAAVYIFDLGDFDEGTPVPEGVREVEVGDNGPDGLDLLVFEDPDTGHDLVAFSREELLLQIMTAFTSLATDKADRFERPGPEVGWSAAGSDWEWQTIPGAFGLTGLTEMESALAGVTVAVGGDFVIARVQTFGTDDVRTYPAEYSDTPPGEDGQSTSMGFSPQPPRWFIAKVS